MATENTGANENKKAGEAARKPRPVDGKTPVKKKKIIIVTGNRVPDSGAPTQADLTPAEQQDPLLPDLPVLPEAEGSPGRPDRAAPAEISPQESREQKQSLCLTRSSARA